MRNFKFFLLVITSLSLFSSCDVFNKRKKENKLEVNHPVTLVKTLADRVEETSGLLFFRNSIWTLNDSGGDPEIYRLDSLSGEVVQVVNIKNGYNTDIEDLTQDDDFIYIGDFGNNLGNRKDLRIYKISKKDISEKEDISVEAEQIQFEYADQKNFQVEPQNNNYDCESIISFGDSLYLFTKNWIDGKTRVYAVPKLAGKYSLEVKAEFPVDGLITAADYSTENGMLSLLGYKDYMPFIWVFRDFNQNNFFDGEKFRLDLENIYGAQTEGLCFNATGDLLISCERSYFTQSLFIVPAQIFKSYNIPTSEKASSDALFIAAGFDADEDAIHIQIRGLIKGFYSVQILNENWLLEDDFTFEAKKESSEHLKIAATELAAGMYYLRIEQNEKLKVIRLHIKKQ